MGIFFGGGVNIERCHLTAITGEVFTASFSCLHVAQKKEKRMSGHHKSGASGLRSPALTASTHTVKTEAL